MSWLINPRIAALLDDAREQRPTAEQQEAYEARTRARFSEAPFTAAGDGVAVVRIEGVLTKRPDLFAQIFGGGNTSYQSIQEALRAARQDKGVRSLRLEVDSPGGTVDGMFETLAELQATRATKPIRVVASNANSAAYALASVAGPIEATTRGATFGSIGAAVSIFTSDRIVTLTNSKSPNKRPDPKTKEGKAAITKELDDITALFVEQVAKGRSVSVDTVYQNFGRGGVLLAEEAQRLGMIDSIAGAPSSESAILASLPTTEAKLHWLQQHRPELFAELVAQGVRQERERAVTLLEGGRLSGDKPSQGLELAKQAIRSGAPVTDAMRESLFLAALQQEREADRQLAIQRARTSPRYADVARRVLGPGTSEGTAEGFAEAVAQRFCRLVGASPDDSEGELQLTDGKLRVWLP